MTLSGAERRNRSALLTGWASRAGTGPRRWVSEDGAAGRSREEAGHDRLRAHVHVSSPDTADSTCLCGAGSFRHAMAAVSQGLRRLPAATQSLDGMQFGVGLGCLPMTRVQLACLTVTGESAFGSVSGSAVRRGSLPTNTPGLRAEFALSRSGPCGLRFGRRGTGSGGP